jgi:hypothetical protein
MDLAPDPALGAAMLAGVPLTFTFMGAVDVVMLSLNLRDL